MKVTNLEISYMFIVLGGLLSLFILFKDKHLVKKIKKNKYSIDEIKALNYQDLNIQDLKSQKEFCDNVFADVHLLFIISCILAVISPNPLSLAIMLISGLIEEKCQTISFIDNKILTIKNEAFIDDGKNKSSI